MAFHRNEEMHPEHNPLVKLLRRLLPVTRTYEGAKFFIRQGGVLMATPLFLVLLIVESTDLIFAVDSIPAIFAVTDNPFIVYTSNVFAILGLRSLYFLLAGIIEKFYYLKLGLSVVLTFVGLKMVLADLYKIPIGLSLAVIVSILVVAIIASLWRARRFSARQQAVMDS
jgi:tellurite resistance protein TerC